MAVPLYELLVPYLDAQDAPPRPASPDDLTSTYLSRLTTLPLAALTSSEPQSLAQSSQSTLRSLQVLSKRSHKQIISSTEHLSQLRAVLPRLGQNVGSIQRELPALESAAQHFSEKYSKRGPGGDNPILEKRRKAMLLSRNIDRVSDILDLPTLLSSAISSSSTAASTQASTQSASATSNANYASALDLYAHIKRLATLYPQSPLILSLSTQAEQEMKTMTTNLITSLQSQGIKLAGAMRTIGWLRRVAPELDESWASKQVGGGPTGEGSLGALFLVCRLTCLESMLSALDPLRELADQESEKRLNGENTRADGPGWALGQQTEKYLKKYLEVFREQSFAIISMYKSIFPSALPAPDGPDALPASKPGPVSSISPLHPLPSALATFPLHLVETLFDTLRAYLPNVRDRSSRDSLLTQVLYCAGSLGRLGGDFSMMIALLEEELREEMAHEDTKRQTEEEWVDVMKKHRVQASRLELLASGVSSGRRDSAGGSVVSPG